MPASGTRNCLQIGFQLAKPGLMKDFAGTWTIKPLTSKDLQQTSAADYAGQSKEQGNVPVGMTSTVVFVGVRKKHTAKQVSVLVCWHF